MALGIGSRNVNNTTENEDIVSNISKSELVEDTQSFSNTTNKNTAIKDYISNLVSKNESKTAIEQNLKQNLETCANVVQENKLVIDELEMDGTDNEFVYRQANKMAQDIADSYENVVNIVNKTIEEQVQSSDLVKQVEDAMKNGTYDNMLDETINNTQEKIDRDVSNKTDKSTNIQAFIAKEKFKAKMIAEKVNSINSSIISTIARTLPRYESFIGKETIDNIAKQKSYTETNNEDLVKKTSIMAVCNDTDVYSKISQAFNQTLETIKEVKQSINEDIQRKISADSKQTNEVQLGKIKIGGNKNKVTIEQINEASNKLVATSIVSAVLNSDMSSETKAIAADMLNLTESFSNETETTKAAETTSETSKALEQKLVNETVQNQEDVGLGAEVTGVVNNAVDAVDNIASTAVNQVGESLNNVTAGAGAFLKIGPIIIICVVVIAVVLIVASALKTGRSVAHDTTGAVVQINKDNPELMNSLSSKIPGKPSLPGKK